MSTVVGRDELMALCTGERVVHQITIKGKTFNILEMTEQQRSSFEGLVYGDGSTRDGFRSGLLAATLSDGNGSRLLTDDEREFVGKMLCP